MGIIEKQSKNNLLILGFAVFLGALNNMVLFPNALSKEEWGIIRFLPSIAIIISNVALFGVPQVLLKYMPAYGNDQKSNNGLLFFCFSISVLGIGLISMLLILFKAQLLGVYEENAARFSDYYNYLFPLLILTALTELMSAFSRAHLFSVFQLFLREILHRVVQAVLLVLLLLGIMDFEMFVLTYSFSQLINLIFLVLFLKSEGILDFKRKHIKSKKQVEILKYGGANFLTGLGATLTGRIDSLMITALVSGGVLLTSNAGLEAVAIYAFGAYMVTIIEMPARAISSIANSIIAKAWEEKDMSELQMIYKKTSINQIIVGGLLFILIWAGIDELFELIGNYQEAKWVVLYLGVGKMIGISFGSVSSIIVSSKYYSYAMYGMMFLAVVTYLLNLVLIPKMGIEGAAIATALALFLYYILSFLLLKIKSNLQPFSVKTVTMFVFISFFFIVAHYVDLGLNPIIEIAIMSIVLGSSYVFGIYILNVSEDMNQTITNILKKTRVLLARKIAFPIIMKLRLEKLLNRSPKNAILNVMYHGVAESKNDKSIIRNIDPVQFEEHLIYLKNNFEILSLDAALTHIKEKKSNLTRRAITLSFDDGYENNLTELLPLLEKYNVPATIYVLGHAIEDNNKITTVWSNYIDFLVEENEFSELNRIMGFERDNVSVIEYYNHVKTLTSDQMKALLISFQASEIVRKAQSDFSRSSYQLLNHKQIKELSNSQLITIGSHAYWHCNLANQSKEVQQKELSDSKVLLEKVLGVPIYSLAYPDGSYTRESIDIAAELGYTNQWAVRYKHPEDKKDIRINDRHGISTQTTFESNMIFLNLAFNKHSL